MEVAELEAIGKAVNGGMAEVKTSLSSLAAQLSEKPAPEPVAEMAEKGIVGGITKFEVWDIPVGQALVGGFVAVFASEVIDGFLSEQTTQVKGLVKLAAAGAAIKFGKGILGDSGSKAVALLLAYDGIRMLLPLDEWASKAVKPITKLTGAGLGGRAVMSDVVDQAEKTAANYYDRAFGG